MFKKIILSTLSDFSRALFLVTIDPAKLKILSDNTLVAGTARYFLANLGVG